MKMKEITLAKAHRLILAGFKVETSESRDQHGHSVFRYFVEPSVLKKHTEWSKLDEVIDRELD